MFIDNTLSIFQHKKSLKILNEHSETIKGRTDNTALDDYIQEMFEAVT
jgi:hypothetical protein